MPQPLARSALVRSLGESHPAAALAPLLQLANGGTNEPALQRVALVALRQFDDDAIGGQLVGQLGGSISAEHSLRDTACRTLATRKAWAVSLLDEVLAWRLRPKDIPVDVAQQLRAYDDPQVALLAERALGKAVVISSEEKLQQMEHLQQLWKQQSADPAAGKEVFAKKCGVCHQLFGEGNTIGPALDAYERGNPRFWLVAIVEPSAEIREGFQSYAALTVDGRLVTGMLAEQTAHGVTIRSADNHMTTIAAEDLEALRALRTSLMPEDVLQDLDDQQLSDLFAYLRSGSPQSPVIRASR
ncbi:MAG: c-type cytochrome [Pirellulaceae bacterium]